MMASSLALKRLLSSNIIPTSSLRLARIPSSSASRLFNTDAVRQFDDYDSDDANDRGIETGRRYGRTLLRRPDDLFSVGVSPYSLSLLNMMDQIIDNPFRGIGGGLRRGWDARETEEGLNLRVEMPGLDKEDVKVSMEQNTLIIKGEGGKDSEDEESGRRYSGRIDLPEKIYRTDQIKAEMKNGILKVVVPKIKDEERNDVFHVKVE